MILGPNWYLPANGIPDLPIAVPTGTVIALALLWLTILAFSSGGIVWEALHDPPQRPIGRSKKGPVHRPPRGGPRRPALYPI
jgi:hypothetical protein